MQVDVACIGHASYDLVFAVPYQPGEDEKCVADAYVACGGGPAANAAVAVARLERHAAFAGFLGNDLHGEAHFQELIDDGVETTCVHRGHSPTPLSAVLVKPDGKRSLINYRGDTRPLSGDALPLDRLEAKAILFDGHEPHVSRHWLGYFRGRGSKTILDAGSLHEGTKALMYSVDYLVASRKFATQWLGKDDPVFALRELAHRCPVVVITLGEEGLIWQRGEAGGELSANPVQVVDTTGAGDTFHGAFATCIADGMGWEETLRFASAAAALCCTRMGGRPGIPSRVEVDALIARER